MNDSSQIPVKKRKLGDDTLVNLYKLLEIESNQEFHQKYTTYFSDNENMINILSKQVKICDDQEFLYFWRQAYLEQTIAQNNNAEIGRLHYLNAIKLLDEMCEKSIDQLTPFKKMLNAHTSSKIYYQIGLLTHSNQSQNTNHDSSNDVDSAEAEQKQAKYNPPEKDQKKGPPKCLKYFKMGFQKYDEVVTSFGCANFVQFFKRYPKILIQLQYFDEYPVQHTYAANMFNFCAYQDSISRTNLTHYMKIIDHMMNSSNLIDQYVFDFRKKIQNFKQKKGLIPTITESFAMAQPPAMGAMAQPPAMGAMAQPRLNMGGELTSSSHDVDETSCEDEIMLLLALSMGDRSTVT